MQPFNKSTTGINWALQYATIVDMYLMTTRMARWSREVKTSVMHEIIHVSSLVLYEVSGVWKESEPNMATRVSSAIIAIETRAGMCDSGMNMENQAIATNNIEGCEK